MSNLVNQAFEHNDPQAFDDLRKLMAADLITDDTGADEAVFLADKGLCEAKSAYDIGNGNGREQDIIEDLIDRETARVSVWVQENGAELVEKGMISRKKDANGRSFNLKTTPKFAEYFKIKGNAEILSKVEMSKLSEILELNKQ